MKKVKLNTIDKVTNFCAFASSVDGEVTIFTDRYVVNGKSILGILSLNLNDFVNVEVNTLNKEKEELFWEQLRLVGIETTH